MGQPVNCYVRYPDFVIHICFFSILGTDIQKELECVKNAIHQSYRIEGKPHIYDPVELEQLCIKAGATTLFHNILIGNNIKSPVRKKHEQNQSLTASIIYKLCFGLSQKANYIQKNNTAFLASNCHRHRTKSRQHMQQQNLLSVCSEY